MSVETLEERKDNGGLINKEKVGVKEGGFVTRKMM